MKLLLIAALSAALLGCSLLGNQDQKTQTRLPIPIRVVTDVGEFWTDGTQTTGSIELNLRGKGLVSRPQPVRIKSLEK